MDLFKSHVSLGNTHTTERLRSLHCYIFSEYIMSTCYMWPLNSYCLKQPFQKKRKERKAEEKRQLSFCSGERFCKTAQPWKLLPTVLAIFGSLLFFCGQLRKERADVLPTPKALSAGVPSRMRLAGRSPVSVIPVHSCSPCDSNSMALSGKQMNDLEGMFMGEGR